MAQAGLSGVCWTERYEKLGWKMAKRFSERYGVDIEELMSAIYLELLVRQQTCRDEHDANKWAFQTIYYACLDHCHKESKFHQRFSPITQETDGEEVMDTRPQPRDWKADLLRELSEEGRCLVQVVIEAPEEIADELTVSTRGRARRAVQRYLIDELDWNAKQVQQVWAEVQACLA